eukprot:g7643.t1
MVRAMYGAFSGPLYRVRRTSDNATLDVGVLAAGGVADGAAHDAFCGAANCTVAAIFDQSPRGNHLLPAPARRGHTDLQADASRARLTVGGRGVHGAYFSQEPLRGAPKEVGVGYRADNTTGVARGDDPESMYMVLDGTHYNGACCF